MSRKPRVTGADLIAVLARAITDTTNPNPSALARLNRREVDRIVRAAL